MVAKNYRREDVALIVLLPGRRWVAGLIRNGSCTDNGHVVRPKLTLPASISIEEEPSAI
jgi:hypothetical protein